MKTTFLCVLISVGLLDGGESDFFKHYRLFLTTRVTKNHTQKALNQPVNATILDATQTKNITRKVEGLKQILENYKDSTGIDLSQSSKLYLLIFTDPQTALERTYVWNESHKLYFEEYIDKTQIGEGNTKIARKKKPQFAESVAVRVVTKDDTVQTLLEKQNKRALHQLAFEHQVDGGETCLGIICYRSGSFSRFAPVELPAFEFIQTYRK